MEVVERDTVDAKACQALLDFHAQHLGPAAAGAAEPALGRDDHIRRRGRQRASDRFLALAVRVEVRRVDHLHASVDRRTDERDVLFRIAEPVRAEADPTELDVAESNTPGAHGVAFGPV